MSLRAKAANLLTRGWSREQVMELWRRAHQRRLAQGIPWAGRAPRVWRGGGGRRRGPSKSQVERWEGQKQKRKERWKKNIINKVVRGKLPYSVLPEGWGGDYEDAWEARRKKIDKNVRRQYGDEIPKHLTYHREGGLAPEREQHEWAGPRTHEDDITIPKRFHKGGGEWDEEGIKKYVAYHKRKQKHDKKDWVAVQTPQGEERIHPTMLRHFRAQRQGGRRRHGRWGLT